MLAYLNRNALVLKLAIAVVTVVTAAVGLVSPAGGQETGRPRQVSYSGPPLTGPFAPYQRPKCEWWLGTGQSIPSVSALKVMYRKGESAG
jgi:hypothetical protein